jgi:C1A family cysteine protease
MMKNARLWLSGLLMVLLLGSYAMADDELDYVKQVISAKGGRWHAGETSVSKLSHEARKMRLGLVSGHMPNATQLPSPSASSVAALPGTLDWRSYNGGSWVTPVRDQGGCGSCWAFAAAATLESSTLIKNNTPNIDLDLSEQVLVSCSGAGSCAGGSPDSASNYIKSTGLPPESCYPYTAADGTCSVTCSNWQTSAYRISGYSYVATTSPTVDAIKNALSTYGPVNTQFDVYSDFFYYTTGVYHYATGTYQGGHAVLIVGYDDVNQYFIVKNSWGTGWGEAGFFRIAYSELNSVTRFGIYTIAYQNGATPPPPPGPICSYSASPTSATYSSSGVTAANLSVTTTGDACAWTASAAASWITITSGSSGTGSGTIAYSVASYTGKNARSGSITVAGQSFSVKQNGARRTVHISTSNPQSVD